MLVNLVNLLPETQTIDCFPQYNVVKWSLCNRVHMYRYAKAADIQVQFFW